MNTPQQSGKPRGHYRTIEDAGAAVNADDDNSIRALADEIFNFPVSYRKSIPPAIEVAAKERLAKAEKAYLQGRGPGIQEQNVVDAMNMVADKLAMPDKAKTSVLQVRYLRVHMAIAEPGFMGKGVSSPDSKIGDPISPEMSPLQTAHLIGILLNQKLHNPEYLVPPEQWDQDHYQKAIDKLKSRAPIAQTTPYVRIEAVVPSLEIHTAIQKAGSSLSMADGLDLLKQVFEKLGIQ